MATAALPAAALGETALPEQCSALDTIWADTCCDGKELKDIGAAFVTSVMQKFEACYPTVKSASHVPVLCADTQAGHLVRLVAMVQHNSLSDQFYVSVVKHADGTVRPLDVFNYQADHFESTEVSEFATFAGRKIVVAVPLQPNTVCESGNNEAKVVLKFYNDFATKVNQVIHVIGFFEPQRKFDGDDDLHSYPFNLPSIHVAAVLSEALDTSAVNFQQSRRKFLDAIKQMCNEAEATKVLLAMMSKIAVRTQGLISSLLVGYYPLNIQIPLAEKSDALITYLASLVSHTTLIRLSGSVLDSKPFVSVLNSATGELDQGLLQIPESSMIIIDERALEPGQLSANAAMNIQHLIDFVNHQIVVFDFAGHQVQIPADAIVVVISHGKSILKLENSVSFTSEFYAPDASVQCTEYLKACRSLNVSISDNVAAEVCKYVDARSKDQDTRIEPNRLSLALNVARLLSASYGSEQVSLEHLIEALEHC